MELLSIVYLGMGLIAMWLYYRFKNRRRKKICYRCGAKLNGKGGHYYCSDCFTERAKEKAGGL